MAGLAALPYIRPVSTKLRITVVDADPERAHMIVDGLCEAGDFDISVLGDETGLARKLAQLAPDVVLIDLASPSRDTLEQLSVASGANSRPVAMFVDRSENGLSDAAIEAGVSAYVVNGMQLDRVKPVLDAAIARFRMFQRMRTELAETKKALEERKVIDRAKGIVMKARGLSEEEAHSLYLDARRAYSTKEPREPRSCPHCGKELSQH